MQYFSEGAGTSAMCTDMKANEELINQASSPPSQSSKLSFE